MCGRWNGGRRNNSCPARRRGYALFLKLCAQACSHSARRQRIGSFIRMTIECINVQLAVSKTIEGILKRTDRNPLRPRLTDEALIAIPPLWAIDNPNAEWYHAHACPCLPGDGHKASNILKVSCNQLRVLILSEPIFCGEAPVSQFGVHIEFLKKVEIPE